MFFNKGFTSVCLGRVEGVDLGNLGDKVGVKFNGVVIGMVQRKLVMSFLREDVSEVFTPFWDDRFP